MKITKSQLKELIKEELEDVVQEDDISDASDSALVQIADEIADIQNTIEQLSKKARNLKHKESPRLTSAILRAWTMLDKVKKIIYKKTKPFYN